MALWPDLDNTESLRTKINQKAPELFEAQSGKPQLQVNRLTKTAGDGEGKESIRFRGDLDVTERSKIEDLRHETNDLSQIFVVRQDRSWTTLNISRELFEDFLRVYGVFSRFWRFVFTFGIKWEENEFEFPGFESRHISPSKSNLDEAYESAYVLRRAELNHRKLTEGQSPWSIRQTAVYHKLNRNSVPSKSSPIRNSLPLQTFKSTFLLIAPSQALENQLHESIKPSISDEHTFSPWNVHRLLVAESLRGWMDYMAWVEMQLREQSDCITLAKVDEEKDIPTLTDFEVNFKNRQTLKILEDSVIDLQIILSTMLSTITGIRDLCKKCCERHHHSNREELCGCDQAIEDFHGNVKEVEMHVKRAKVLREKTKSTTQLLADLLSYEDALALKDLTRESRVESKSMRFLTERSTKDAAAVKALTVISLVYLPTTIVAVSSPPFQITKKHKANDWKNFFSTQFVHTGESGNMQVSTSAWLLAAIAVPLTIFTIIMWWMWVRYVNVSLPNASLPPSLPAIPRKNRFQALLSPRKKQPSNDIESRIASPQATVYKAEPSPRPLGGSSAGTWSSRATTLKSG